jgi:hypothetical protein
LIGLGFLSQAGVLVPKPVLKPGFTVSGE